MLPLEGPPHTPPALVRFEERLSRPQFRDPSEHPGQHREMIIASLSLRPEKVLPTKQLEYQRGSKALADERFRDVVTKIIDFPLPDEQVDVFAKIVMLFEKFARSTSLADAETANELINIVTATLPAIPPNLRQTRFIHWNGYQWCIEKRTANDDPSAK